MSEQNNKTAGQFTKISCVSGKLLKFRAKIPKEQRLRVIEENYGVISREEMASLAGVNVRTIYSDIREWKASDRYVDWLDLDWMTLHRSGAIRDEVKYVALTKLKMVQMANVKGAQGSSSVMIRIIDDVKKVGVSA